MKLRHLAIASTMLLATSGIAASQDAKLTDPQIAHIAYTAGQIDIAAGRARAEEVEEQGGARLRRGDGPRSHGGQ